MRKRSILAAVFLFACLLIPAGSVMAQAAAVYGGAGAVRNARNPLPMRISASRFESTSPWLAGNMDESIYENNIDAKEEDQNISEKRPGFVEKGLAELIRNAASSLISLLQNKMGASIDRIVFGRVGSGSPNGVNVFAFELRKGNPYGVTGSICYSLLRGMMYAFLGIWFVMQLAKAAWSGQTAKSREEIKSMFPMLAIKFVAMTLMPHLLDVVLYVRDVLLYGIKEVTAEMVAGGATLSLSEAFLFNAERSGTFVDAVMYLGTVILTIYFVFLYVAVAIDMLVCFVSFPFLCVLHSRKKDLISGWVMNMLSDIMTPVIDAVLLLIPLLTSVMLYDVVDGIAVIELVMCMLIIPARGRFKALLGLQSNDRNGFVGAMAMLSLGRAVAGKVKQGAGRLADAVSDARNSRTHGELADVDREEEQSLLSGDAGGRRPEGRAGSDELSGGDGNPGENADLKGREPFDETDAGNLREDMSGLGDAEEDGWGYDVPDEELPAFVQTGQQDGGSFSREAGADMGGAETGRDAAAVGSDADTDTATKRPGQEAAAEGVEAARGAAGEDFGFDTDVDAGSIDAEGRDRMPAAEVGMETESNASGFSGEPNGEDAGNAGSRRAAAPAGGRTSGTAGSRVEMLRDIDSQVEAAQGRIDSLRQQRADMVAKEKQISKRMLDYQRGSGEYRRLELEKADAQAGTARIDSLIAGESGKLNRLRAQSRQLHDAAGMRNTPTDYDERRMEILRKRANISNFEQPQFRGVLSNDQMRVLYRKRAIANGAKAVAGTAGAVAFGAAAGSAAVFVGPSASAIAAVGGISAGNAAGQAGVDVAVEIARTAGPAVKAAGGKAYHMADMAASAYVMHQIRPAAMQVEVFDHSMVKEEIHNAPPVQDGGHKEEPAQEIVPEDSVAAAGQEIRTGADIPVADKDVARVASDAGAALQRAMTQDGMIKSSNVLRAMQQANVELEREIAVMREEGGRMITDDEVRRRRVEIQTDAVTDAILWQMENRFGYERGSEDYAKAEGYIRGKVSSLLQDREKPLV